MSEVSLDCGRLIITDRDDGGLTLARKEGGALQELGLYCVTRSDTRYTATYHVLAESEEGAISQANCGKREITAKRIPFLIRSWGSCPF